MYQYAHMFIYKYMQRVLGDLFEAEIAVCPREESESPAGAPVFMRHISI